MVKTKVFVGNLSFKTQDADLAKEFEVAGKVASTNIIARGTRSLGYGFVEMESEEEARKAVELLNKKLLDDREINVELAKPADETKEPRPRNPRPPRQPRAPGAAGVNNGQAGGVGLGGGGGGEGGVEGGGDVRRPRRPNNRRRAPRKNADGSSPLGVGGPVGEGGGVGGGAPRRERPPRAPRAPRPDAPPRVAAPNSLFIANLPFTVDDAGLAQIFAGLNLKAAHVVRKHNNRSKGFAFAEFNSEEDQKKALAAVDKKTVDGRELSVKLARTEPAAAAVGGAPGSPAVGNLQAEQKKEAAPASPKTA